MQMSRDWRENSILIAGCGSIGFRHAKVLADLGIRDITVFDAAAKQAEKLQKEIPFVKTCPTYEDGLASKPDAVFILTPTALHVPMAIQAVEAGCDCFIEKPLSQTVSEVDALLKLRDETGCKVMVGFCFRYHEGLLKAKSMVADGRIGRLVSIRALMGEHFPTVRPDYLNTYYAEYSGAFELVHDLDLAIWFAGQPLRQISGVYGAFSDIGIKAPDTVEILLEFEDRCVATVHLDFFQTPRRRQLELIGTEGTLIVEFASWDRYTLSVFSRSEDRWDSFTGDVARNDMFAEEDRDFLQAISGTRSINCSIEEALKSLEVVESLTQKRSSC